MNWNRLITEKYMMDDGVIDCNRFSRDRRLKKRPSLIKRWAIDQKRKYNKTIKRDGTDDALAFGSSAEILNAMYLSVMPDATKDALGRFVSPEAAYKYEQGCEKKLAFLESTKENVAKPISKEAKSQTIKTGAAIATAGISLACYLLRKK